MWSRIHLIPLLQAEEDRDLVRKTLAARAMEKELFGAESKVYNSDRYVEDLLEVGCERTDILQVCAANICGCACEYYQVIGATTANND